MKRILGIICLLLTAVFFMGCGKNTQTDVSVPKSDDIYSFEIALNGKLYTLPADFSEFEKNGWTIDENKSDKKIEPNDEMTSISIKNGKSEASITLANYDINELSANKCTVIGIGVSDLDTDDGTKLVLPKGITIDSTKDDITNAYGTPTESEEITPPYKDVKPFMSLEYRIQVEQSIEFDISEKSNKVTGINIKNAIIEDYKSTDSKIEDANSSDSIVENGKSTAKKDSSSKNDSSSDEVPESVTKYKAPTELTNNIYSFNIKYDGALYTLPAPIAEFKKNGWEVSEDPGIISARDSKFGVVLKKGNQTLDVDVDNDSPNATSVENCFVAGIRSEYKDTIPLELPKGIKIGSSKEDVDLAYSDYEAKKDGSDDSSVIERYTYEKNALQSIQLIIDKKTNTVAEIHIQNMP